MKRGECEGEAFGVELTTVIGEREGGVRGQREAVGGGSLWAPAGKQRFRRCRGSDRLPVVCVSGRQLSDWWDRAILTGWAGTVDMGWVQSGAQPFSNYSNFAPILKYTTKTILMSINVQTWHGARVDYSEQFLPLGPLLIPNRIPVIKFGTNSTLNLSLNFKGFHPFLKNLINSLKFHVHMIFAKMNIVGYTCM
jgi:hypothetical protein